MQGRGTVDRAFAIFVFAVFCSALSLGWLHPSHAAASAYVVDWEWSQEPVLDVAAADLTGDGKSDIVAVTKDTVHVFEVGAEGLVSRWELKGFAAPLTLAALVDLDGNGTQELLVGTEDTGGLFLYERHRDGLVRLGRSHYLWSAVKQVVVADVDGDGGKEILALNSDGELFLIAWSGYDYQLGWRSGQTLGKIRYLAAADFNGDGRASVVVSRAQGFLGQLAWNGAGFDVVWENYPWGSVLDLVLTDVDNDGQADVLVTTSQDIAYLYRWKKTTLGLERHIPDTNLPTQLWSAGTSKYYGTTRRGAVATLTFDNSGFHYQWDEHLVDKVNDVLADSGTHPDPGIILAANTGLVHLRPVPDNFARLTQDGEEAKFDNAPVFENDTVYVSLQDWARLFGMSLQWSQETRMLTVIRGFQYAVLEPGRREVLMNGHWVSLDSPVRIVGGRVYADPSFATALGVDAKWNRKTRTLAVTHHHSRTTTPSP